MIREAVEFAVEAHKGAVRKGTQTPYIVHPLEAAVIVGSMTEDQELVAAAILHDVLEDTDAREEDLRQRFGDRVADLVVEETDDKTLSWLERKKGKLERVARGSRDLKMVGRLLGSQGSRHGGQAEQYPVHRQGLPDPGGEALGPLQRKAEGRPGLVLLGDGGLPGGAGPLRAVPGVCEPLPPGFWGERSPVGREIAEKCLVRFSVFQYNDRSLSEFQ